MLCVNKIFTFIILLAGLSACTVRPTIEMCDSFDTIDSISGKKHDIPPIMLYPKSIFLLSVNFLNDFLLKFGTQPIRHLVKEINIRLLIKSSCD